MRRLLDILLWSVISAAFLGPGTVTTAAAAGARHGLALVWALVFSTLTCLVLQEAAGRLTVASGRDLGTILREQGGRWLPWTAAGAVILGCAAYEAGNVLGGVAGLDLVMGGTPARLAALCVLAAAVLLWMGSTQLVARLLGLVVAAMGVVFVATAVSLRPSLAALARGAVTVAVPGDAAPLIVGLVGTTVVPYNLFLGSGLAHGHRLADLRLGLAVAIPLGGVISIAVMIVGTALPGTLDFARLAAVLESQLGVWARTSLALGLFAAGFSSAITAPLAAAITASSAFAEPVATWSGRDGRTRAVWGGVLAAGLLFGVSGLRPIPVIILAQIFNGLLLPFIAIVLFVAVNDRRLMADHVNGLALNALTTGVVVVTIVLGLASVARGVSAALHVEPLSPARLTLLAGASTLALAWPIARHVRRVRSR
jgi:manganese transport protein